MFFDVFETFLWWFDIDKPKIRMKHHEMTLKKVEFSNGLWSTNVHDVQDVQRLCEFLHACTCFSAMVENLSTWCRPPWASCCNGETKVFKVIPKPIWSRKILKVYPAQLPVDFLFLSHTGQVDPILLQMRAEIGRLGKWTDGTTICQ